MKKDISGWFFIFPAILWFVVFSIYPIFRSIQLGFYDAGVIHSEFTGIQNFIDIFQTERIVKGFINTLKFTAVCAPLMTFIPLLIAMLGFRMRSWLQKSIRFAFYMPALTAGPVIAMVWAWLFRPGGLINVVSGTALPWLGANPTAFYAICIILVSSDLGLAIIIYMASMGGINEDLYDAARMDGCSQLQEEIYITLPHIKPIIGFIFFIKIIGVAQIWQYPYLLTGGGPNYGTTTAVLEIYIQAFQFGKYGVASAIGIIFVVAVGALAFIQRKFFKGESDE